MKLKIVHIQLRKFKAETISKILKHIHKYIIKHLFIFKLQTNITSQNISLKGLKRKQNVLKLEAMGLFF